MSSFTILFVVLLVAWIGGFTVFHVAGGLAEEDEVRRSNMLRAADRFLKESNEQSLDIPLLSEGPL